MEVVSKGDHPPEITFRFWICVFHTFDFGEEVVEEQGVMLGNQLVEFIT